ncbi:MAG: tetratricopeptide repeat protein [Acidobacteriota bacterium]
MAQEHPLYYEFANYRLDVVKRLLLSEQSPVDLPPKAFDILLLLIEHHGTVLEKETIIKKVWPDTFVEEGNLTYYISLVRKSLGETPGEHKFIVTIPKRGYSFVAEVRKIFATPSALRFSQNGVATIAANEKSTEPGLAKSGATPVTNLAPTVNDETPVQSETLKAESHPQPKFNLKKAAMIAALILLIMVAGFWLIKKLAAPREEFKSIAILPFKLLNSNSDCDGCLELGMADALIAKLSKLENLSVRPTSAILTYNERQVDPLAAGRELGVDVVMEGTVQRVNQRVRVRVQLINIKDGRHLWAEQFDEEIGNIFRVQDSISEQVAQALTLRINNDDKQKLRRNHTDNLEAYNTYIRGVFFWTRREQGGIEKGIEQFQRAIALDANYAKAYAMLADAYGLLAIRSSDMEKRRDYFEKAEAAANRALAIDDTLAEAHTAKALVLTSYKRDIENAEKAYKKALQLDPNYSTAHVRYGWFLLNREQLNLALNEMQKAAELDPVAVINSSAYANLLYLTGQYDQAIEQCQKILEVDPNFYNAYLTLGQSYEQKGQYQQALDYLQKYDARQKDNLYSLESLGHLYGVLGKADEAERRIAQLEKLAAEDGSALLSIVIIKCGLGKRVEAAEWLKKVLEKKSVARFDIRFDPRIKPLLEDPNFQDIQNLVANY